GTRGGEAAAGRHARATAAPAQPREIWERNRCQLWALRTLRCRPTPRLRPLARGTGAAPAWRMRAWCVLVVLGCDGGMLTENPGDANVSVDAAAATDDAAPPVPGLRAEYFAGYMDLALDRVEPALDHDWGNAAPDPAVGQTDFSVRWTAQMVAPATGSYQIITDTDDGVRVFVGDRMVIDDWHGQYVTRNMASVDLTAGVAVPLRVEYFQIDLAASARMQVMPPVDLFAPAQPSGLPGPKPPYSNPVIAHDCP